MYKIKSYANGFEYIEVQNSLASAKIALQGAHIYEYIHKQRGSLLWMSRSAVFEIGTPIRGGIPLCWPRFGSQDTTMQQHGFARTSLFRLSQVRELDDGSTELTLLLQESQATLELWPYAFELEFIITIGDRLTLALRTSNWGGEKFMLTQAFHTYFAISNINNIAIKGLEQKIFLDTLDMTQRRESKALEIAQEVDRVYQDVDETIILCDKERELELETEGSDSAIVWNPWKEKCAKMSYMEGEAYREFVCIESANAFEDFKIIESKKTHTLKLVISFS